MIQLVIINGLGGCGKSTFISKCADYCRDYEDCPKVVELSTVDFVKKIASLCGWKGTKTTEDRVFLSDLKKAMAKWNNIPINDVFNSISVYAKTDLNYIIFINSREPDDMKEIYKKAAELGYLTTKLLITNPNSPVNEVPELIDCLNKTNYDMTIENNGNLDDLRFKAALFVQTIMNNW